MLYKSIEMHLNRRSDKETFIALIHILRFLAETGPISISEYQKGQFVDGLLLLLRNRTMVDKRSLRDLFYIMYILPDTHELAEMFVRSSLLDECVSIIRENVCSRLVISSIANFFFFFRKIQK
jgi:hypothetical protein